MFPVARGANGQPPMPPIEASSKPAPPSSAAIAFAYPVLRVLCRWTPIGVPTLTAAATSARTRVGVLTPIVSARTISSGAASASSATISAIQPGSTAPSNGQPNEAPIVTVTRRPSARERPTRRTAVVIDSATEAP